MSEEYNSLRIQEASINDINKMAEISIMASGGMDEFFFGNLNKDLDTSDLLCKYYKDKKRFGPFDRVIVGFSKEFEPLHAELDKFIDKEIIYHASIYRADDHATKIIRALFKFYYRYPSQLPDYVLRRAKESDPAPPNSSDFIRIICDTAPKYLINS